MMSLIPDILTSLTHDLPVDLGRLGLELAALTGGPVQIVTTGADPAHEADTTYAVVGVTPGQMATAVAASRLDDRGRSLLIDAAAVLEEVVAGEREWADVADGGRLIAAALLVAVDAIRSAPAMRAVDTGKPCYTAREEVERRKAGLTPSGPSTVDRTADVPPAG
jgi:hypothetical protein